jgi:hypothetical protein
MFYYLHTGCLINLLKSDKYVDGELVMEEEGDDRALITHIRMCDRFGEHLYKTNYTKKLAEILQKVYEKECKEDFLACIRVLYTIEADFPRVTYRFNGDEVRFERIKKKCNARYASKNIILDPSIKEVTKAFYRGGL